MYTCQILLVGGPQATVKAHEKVTQSQNSVPALEAGTPILLQPGDFAPTCDRMGWGLASPTAKHTAPLSGHTAWHAMGAQELTAWPQAPPQPPHTAPSTAHPLPDDGKQLGEAV